MLLEHIGKTSDGPGRGSFNRSGRNSVDADAERSEVVGEIAHTVLQRSFCKGHDVVVGDDTLAGHVRQGKHTALVGRHERGSTPGYGDEGVCADVHGGVESAARNLAEFAL